MNKKNLRAFFAAFAITTLLTAGAAAFGILSDHIARRDPAAAAVLLQIESPLPGRYRLTFFGKSISLDLTRAAELLQLWRRTPALLPTVLPLSDLLRTALLDAVDLHAQKLLPFLQGG